MGRKRKYNTIMDIEDAFCTPDEDESNEDKRRRISSERLQRGGKTSKHEQSIGNEKQLAANKCPQRNDVHNSSKIARSAEINEGKWMTNSTKRYALATLWREQLPGLK
ncbi:Envelope glycoprotein [Phytophthora palmivora]|uniref:Envelope glycoprotein n=1 Tax=Phytophthora palmivora TaxID=4796 RepID=A0A2P4XZ39_9STRA|nr:Envelope glycoprotein [Phytophthora palmivora]